MVNLEFIIRDDFEVCNCRKHALIYFKLNLKVTIQKNKRCNYKVRGIGKSDNIPHVHKFPNAAISIYYFRIKRLRWKNL